MNLKTILVPLDGSALAETALAGAASLAGPDAMVIVLRAAEAPTIPGADPTDAQVAVVKEAEEYLGRTALKLERAGVPNVRTSVWYGPAAPAIVEAARLHKADLIVMGTHGRSGLGRLILGSVAESVLRGTKTPILLLRADGAPLDLPAVTAATPKEIAHA